MKSTAQPPAGAPATPAGAAQHGDDIHLDPRQGELLVRLAESASAVARRSQFFVWTQGPLHALLPHAVLCCGAYARPRRALSFTVFHSVLLSAEALAPLRDAQSAFMQACASSWVQGGGRALRLDPARLDSPACGELAPLALELPELQLIVHGVSRPQRAAEIESLFVFLAARPESHRQERALHAELLLPYLHATWRRVHANEAAQAPEAVDGAAAGLHGRAGPAAAPLTEREGEILRCVREGKSNQEIGAALAISALTVKNHIQKILRKLGANNRAHALALAISQGLL